MRIPGGLVGDNNMVAVPLFRDTNMVVTFEWKKYGETPSLIMVKPEQFMKANHFEPALRLEMSG